jgi:hypothetical protein
MQLPLGSANLLAIDRRNAIFQALVYALPIGLIVGAAIGPLRGLIFALAIGITVALSGKAWGRWLVLARFWLPLTGRLPWRLGTFLADAHRRGVLRQAGTVYQFRHLRLKEHLARAYQSARDEEAGQVTSSTRPAEGVTSGSDPG